MLRLAGSLELLDAAAFLPRRRRKATTAAMLAAFRFVGAEASVLVDLIPVCLPSSMMAFLRLAVFPVAVDVPAGKSAFAMCAGLSRVRYAWIEL